MNAAASDSLYELIAQRLDSDSHEMQTWLALVSCFSTVENTLMRRFNRKYNSSLPRYDVLTALALFPDGLSMGDLARRLMVSKGNITGVIRRLEKDGLVMKIASKKDRRVQRVSITSAGMSLWDDMQQEYAGVIKESLAGLSAEQAAELTESLATTRTVIDRAAHRD